MILSCEEVGDASASQEAYVLHGILGSNRNWRSFARQLQQVRPDWRFVLVDLRNHGASGRGDRPNDLQACASDLIDTAAARGRSPDAVIGHSFGGKVTLAYLRAATRPPAQAWVLDALPGRLEGLLEGDDGDVARVIRVLSSLRPPFSSRAAVSDALTKAGLSPALVAWMGTNLTREEEGLVWRFDLGGVREMLVSYGAEDLWPVVAETPAEVHLVRAGRSDRWIGEEGARADREAAEGRIVQHVLRESGHWVHVDAADELLAMLARSLPRAGGRSFDNAAPDVAS